MVQIEEAIKGNAIRKTITTSERKQPKPSQITWPRLMLTGKKDYFVP